MAKMQIHSHLLAQEITIEFLIDLIVDHSKEGRKVLAVVSNPNDMLSQKIIRIFTHSEITANERWPRAKFGNDSSLIEDSMAISFGVLDRLSFATSSTIILGACMVITEPEI